MASSKRFRFLYFLLKNSISRKTFGKAPLEKAELEQEKSPTKQALNIYRYDLHADNFNSIYKKYM